MLSEKVFKGQWDSNSRPLRQEPTTPTPRPPARAQNSFNFWYHAHLIDGHLRHAEVDVERLVDHEPDDEGDLNQKQPENSAPAYGGHLLVDQGPGLVTSEPLVPNDSK